MPTLGWITLNSTELSQAKSSGGFDIRTRQEPGSGDNGKWYLHTLATYDTTQYSEYKSVVVDFGTAQKPTTTIPSPTLTATANNTNWATSRSISVKTTGTGTVSYRLSSDTTYKTLTLTNGSATVTVNTNGTYVFRMVTEDDTIIENVEVSKIDRVNPVAKVEEIDVQNSTATTKPGVYTKISIPISISDADSGLKTLQYAFTNSSTTPSSSSYTTASSVNIKSLNYTATQSSETNIYLHIKITDNVNKTATAKSVAYRVISKTAVDNYAPKITVSGGISSWTNDMPTLTWELSNHTDKNYVVTLPNGKTSTDSSGTYLATKNDTYLFSVEELDYGKTNSDSVKISYLDTTAPTVAVSGIPAGTVSSAQTVKLTLTDSQSGVKGGKYAVVSDNKEVPTTGFTSFTTSTVSIPVDGNGTYYIYYEAYDKAGGTVQIDGQTTAERPSNTASGFTNAITIKKHVHDNITFDKEWTEISGEISESGNYYLSDGITATGTIEIATGAEVTLCLNGHVLNLNGTGIKVNSGATLNVCDCDTSTRHKFTVDSSTGLWTLDETNGTETLTGGVITGGYSTYGGAIYNFGTVNLYGGNLAGNTAGSNGGGVGNFNGSIFNMSGGVIIGNTASTSGGGGGVYNYNSTFEMSGGTITDNTAGSYGGGVYNNGAFTLSGTVDISGNTLSDGSTVNNVYLNSGKVITIGTDGVKTPEGKPIGVTTRVIPDAGSPVAISGANTTDYSKCFTSDNSNYTVIYDSNDNKLKLAVAHTHEWSTAWSGDADGHWHVCVADGCDGTIDRYAAHKPNADDGTCLTEIKCSECGYITTPSATAHSFTNKASKTFASAADCQNRAKYYAQCNNCNVVSDTITVEVGELGDHNWDTEWSKDGDNHWHKCLIDGCTEISGEKAHSSTEDNVATYTKKAICDVCGTEYGEKLVDSIAPTGEISIGENGWLEFWNTVTFGLFCKNYVEIEITGADAETDVKSIEYYLSDTAINDEDIKSITAWQTYSQKIRIDADRKVFVYAKITDNAGNAAYLSVDGGVVVFKDTEVTTDEYDYTLTTKDNVVTNIKLGNNKVKEIDLCEPGGNAGDVLDYFINDDGYIVLKGESLEAFTKNWYAGDYTVTITYNALGETYVDGTSKGDKITDTVITLTVERFKVEKPAADSTVFTYNGSEQTYNIPESEYYTVTGNKRTNAGEQDVTVALKDKNTYEWADGTTEDLTFKFDIGEAKVTPPTINSKAYTGETLTADVSDTDLYIVTSNLGGKNVAAYDVVLTLKDGDNYKWDATEGVDGDKITLKFRISKEANEWIKAPAMEGWTYGETAKVPTGTAKFIEGDYGIAYYDKDKNPISNPSDAGEYFAQIFVAATEDFNGLTSEYLPFTIEKAPLTITANNHTITYGDKPDNDGVKYSGFVNGETETVLVGTLAYDYSYAQFGDVGNTYTITPKDVTAANYDITFNEGKLTVNPLEAEIEWSTLNEGDLVYDGNANTLTATVKNRKNDDAVSFEIDLTGDNINVTADGFYYTATGLTGDKADNYTLGSALESPTYKITKATPNMGTVSVSGPENIYLNTELDSIVLDRTDESVEGVLKLTAGQTLTVGTRDYDWTFTPNDTRNYDDVNGKVSVTVEKIKLDVSSISWDVEGSPFTYDGSEKSVTLVGTLPTGVVVEKLGDTATNAGDYTATAIFKLAEGYDNGVYEIVGAVDNKVSANWAINPKTVTPIIEATDGGIYDGTEKEPAVKVYDGDTEIPASEYTIAYTDNINAGNATVTVTDQDGGNYIVNGTKNFTIGNAAFTTDVEQDGSLTYNSTEQSATVKANESGIKGSQTVTYKYGLTENACDSTTVPAFKDAGKYTVYFVATANNHNDVRSGNNPTIFVGQFEVSEWHERLGGGTQADSIMDRIVHNAYEIPSTETNLRKLYDSKKLANLKAAIEK